MKGRDLSSQDRGTGAESLENLVAEPCQLLVEASIP
jgi:hypothetical protein